MVPVGPEGMFGVESGVEWVGMSVGMREGGGVKGGKEERMTFTAIDLP